MYLDRRSEVEVKYLHKKATNKELDLQFLKICAFNNSEKFAYFILSEQRLCFMISTCGF